MATRDNAASERSPLLLPSSSSTTIADESVSTASESEEDSKISTLRGSILGACIAVLIFLQTANFSLMTTIQSSIAVDLDAYKYASWFTSTYLIAGASITPLAGRLCQIFSPRAYILVSSLIMAAGALVTSISPRLAVFLVGRALNGVGGAAVFPVSIILVIELTSMKRRALYIGCVNTCYTIGIALGAVAAGALQSVVGWRGIFGLQVPLAVSIGLGIFFAIPSITFSKQDTTIASRTARKSSPESETLTNRLSQIDFLGLLFLILTITLLLFGLSTPRITLLPILLSLPTLLLFLLVESNLSTLSIRLPFSRSTTPITLHLPRLLTPTQPIIPLPLLTSLPILLTSLSTLLTMSSRWTLLFYTPIFSLTLQHLPPSRSGLILLPTNLGFALGNLLVGLFHIRSPTSRSYYLSSLIALSGFAISVAVLATLTSATVHLGGFFFVAALNGLMIGAAMIYTLTHLLHRTPRSSHFIVSGLIAMFRGLSASFGSAIGGGVFSRVLKQALETGFVERGVRVGRRERDLIRRLLGSPALVAGLEGVEGAVAREGYGVALRLVFGIAAVVACVGVGIQAGVGWRGVGEEGEGEEGESDEDEEEEEEEEVGLLIAAGRD